MNDSYNVYSFYIKFKNDAQINLDSIRTSRDWTANNGMLSRKTFSIFDMRIPTETKLRLANNNIKHIKKAIINDEKFPSLKNHIIASTNEPVNRKELEKVLKDLSNDPYIEYAELPSEKKLLEGPTGFPSNALATCGRNTSWSTGNSQGFGLDNVYPAGDDQYAYQWYLEPHAPSLWPYTTANPNEQNASTFDWENGMWDTFASLAKSGALSDDVFGKNAMMPDSGDWSYHAMTTTDGANWADYWAGEYADTQPGYGEGNNWNEGSEWDIEIGGG